MSVVILDLLWPPVFGLAWPWILARAGLVKPPDRIRAFAGWWAFAASCDLLIDAVAGLWLPAAISLASALGAVFVWWWRRRKDRRAALAALGAKSWARISAIARKARENARPSPVRRPVLGGAR